MRKISIPAEDYGSGKWGITFHTCNFDGTEPGQDQKGHDWSIGYDGFNIFYEGRGQLTVGEARQLVEMLNKCAIYPISIERHQKTAKP